MSIIQLAANIEDMPEYEPLPQGRYRAEVRDVEMRVSEKLPNGYFLVQFVVDPADYPADYDANNAPEGVILSYARVRVPSLEDRRATRPFKAFLTALGIDASGAALNTDDWIGRQAVLLVSVSEYQGAPVNNVESVEAVPTA